MSNTVSTPSAGKLSADEPRLIQQRFSLRRRMAQTALADVYWANDLHGISQTVPESIVLLLLVTPALTGMPDFAQGWNQAMNRPAPTADAYPDIIAYGEDRGMYWLACRDIKGTLLSEFIQGLGEQGLPTEQALDMADTLSQTATSIQAGAFGYLEPGAILRTDQGYKILNAPLVKIIHQLITRNNAGSRHPLSLHSSYLSPSVAVGDVPIQEDDTFSVGCILHALFTGVPPYGSQSTLAAAARADLPATTNRFKPESQDILTSALALQRNQRPESPEVLLQSIRRKSKRKMLFPLAVLAAAGVVTYASYHLLSRVDGLLHTPPETTQAIGPEATPAPATAPEAQPVIIGAEPNTDTTAAPETNVELVDEKPLTEPTAASDTPVTETAQTTQTTAQITDTSEPTPATDTNTPPPETEIAQTASPEPAAPAQAASAPATESAQTEPTPAAEPVTASQDQQPDILPLLTQAEDALASNQLETRNGNPGAIELLRQAWALDRENATTRDLLNRVLQSKQQQVESLISRSRLDDAKQALAENDELMREFVLTDQIQGQVKLENRIEVREREQEEAQTLLEQARSALKRGRLTREDGGNSNALEYLTKLMFMLPNHNEGHGLLEQIVQRRHEATRKLLGRGELEQAGTYLGETERLIRKYNLSKFKGTQATLDKGYQRAIDQAATPKIQEAPAQEVTTQAIEAPPSRPAEPVAPAMAAPRNRMPQPQQPRVVYTPAPDPTTVTMEQPEQGRTVLLPPPENSDPLTSREVIPLPIEPMPNETVLLPPNPMQGQMQEQMQVQPLPEPVQEQLQAQQPEQQPEQPTQGQSLGEMTLEQRVLQTRQQRQQQAVPQQPVQQQPEPEPQIPEPQIPEPQMEAPAIQEVAPAAPIEQMPAPIQQQPAQAPEEMSLEQRVLQARQAGQELPPPASTTTVMEPVPFVEGNPNAPTPNLEPVPFDDQLVPNQ